MFYNNFKNLRWTNLHIKQNNQTFTKTLSFNLYNNLCQHNLHFKTELKVIRMSATNTLWHTV